MEGAKALKLDVFIAVYKLCMKREDTTARFPGRVAGWVGERASDEEGENVTDSLKLKLYEKLYPLATA